MRLFTVAFMLVLILTPCHGKADGTSWKLISKRGDVLLYKEINSENKHKMYKAVVDIDEPIEVVMTVLLDAGNLKDWIPGCFLSDILEERSVDNVVKNYTIHMAWDVPWPIKNRDFVVETKAVHDWNNGIFNVVLQSVERPEVPSPKGCLKLPSLYGKFEGEYVSRDKTRITYYSVFDPGGRVPVFGANMFTGHIARNVLKGLKGAASKDVYKNTAHWLFY